MNPKRAVGILGGGQLARMLSEAAARLGLRPVVLAESASDPAAQIAPGAVFGKLTEETVLRRFFSQVPLVVFENEFVNTELLRLAADGKSGFIPGLDAIAVLQDKLNQKRILDELMIRSAEYEEFSGEDLKKWVSQVSEKFSNQVVFKWARFGYDGKGTLVSPSSPAEAIRFCEKALEKNVRVFAERKIRFRRELSLVSSYSTTGELASYPLVISQAQTGICKLVTGPAIELGVSAKLQSKAEAHASRLARHISLHGSFAIEFFETEEGVLSVNELAPRVHNTGHFSLDCAVTSQFENHWRAVLGLPLGSTRTAPAFAMLNLIGPGDGNADAVPQPSARTSLHWYGKEEVRSGRKMGHLNGQVKNTTELPGLLDEMKSVDRRWMDEVLKAK
jgi:5-(carboxyamino)imidazole ribonucleotide synthase